MIKSILFTKKDKEIKLLEGDSFAAILSQLPEGIYEVNIKKHRNKRSAQQNRYYWGIVIPFIQDFFNCFGTGFPMTTSQAHIQFKDMAGLFEEVQIWDKEDNILKTQRYYHSFKNAGDITTVDFLIACDVVREAIIHKSHGEYVLPQPDSSLRTQK